MPDHKSHSLTRWILPLAVGLLAVAGWTWLIVLFDIPAYNLPTPLGVLEALVAEWEAIAKATRHTAIEAVVGFLAAVGFGYAIAMGLSLDVRIKAAFYPWVIVLQMIPVVVLAPIFVLWLAPGFPSVVAITFLISFFPIVANTVMGMGSTDRALVDLFRMYNASRIQELFLLRMPYSLPYFLTGLKVAGTLAPIGALTGDMLAGSASSETGGLGFLVIVYKAELKIPALFASAGVSCLVGFVFVAVVNLAHWYFLREWHESAAAAER